MLMDLRERIQGWIAYLIIGLISVPFMLWGVGEYFSGGKNKPVAEVDGLPITEQAFEQAVSAQRQALIQKLGGKVSAELLQSLNVKEQVLNQMIDERVLSLFAHRAGFRAPDSMVADLIRSEPAFKTNGAFDVKKYEEFIAAQGTTVPAFEARLKQDIVMRTLETALRESAITVQPDMDMLVRLRDQTREAGYITLARSRVVNAVSAPTEDQIKAYYTAHQSEFVQPERVKLHYIELSPQTLAPLVKVTDAELKQAYEHYKTKQEAAVTRTVRHILISVPKDADAATVEAAKEKLLAIRTAILSGKKTFEAEAKAVSDDPGSKAQGGNLGEVAPGQMFQPFETAMDALKVGELSEPVRTQYGWHLIEVTKESKPDIKPLDAVRPGLVAEVQARHVEKVYYDESEKLSDITYEHPDSLIPAAEALGLKVQTSDWVSRESGKGIGENEKVRHAAFSKDVLTDKLNSNLVELGTDHAVVIRLNTHEPASHLALDEVRQQITQRLKAEAVDQRLAAEAKQIRQALSQGTDPQQAATAAGGVWHAPVWLKRQDHPDGLPPEIIQAAFATPPTADSHPASTSIHLKDGDEAVVVVTQIKSGDPSTISAEDKQQLAAQIEQAEGQSALAALLATLRQETKITINSSIEKSATQ
ncbi:SurA N-terminal domain-containing protein [Halothiobacillus sp.]|uniref:SurA N-terminal domain-containing protein n=1 Tax=Halothiobacillus sp. TaxID=1891311 RepID=UPI002AD516BB|nr:SurA N-terminal domain-containing protein [Halothiobacillus sp.]